jgi:hypothetical protein
MTIRKEWSDTSGQFDPLVQIRIRQTMEDIVRHATPKQSQSILPPLPEAPPPQNVRGAKNGWVDQKPLRSYGAGFDAEIVDAGVAKHLGGPNAIKKD